MTKLFNPAPSYSWEPLDLEEVYKQTGIRLKNKEWRFYFTNFHAIESEVHKDNCSALKSKRKYDCYCKPEKKPAIIAICRAGTKSEFGRGKEFFVNVPVEYISELHRNILTNSELRPEHIQERLYQGYETLITILKVYEVTGFALDFGPPMRLYEETNFAGRRYLREISGDELFEIIHREEKECLKEAEVLLLQS